MFETFLPFIYIYFGTAISLGVGASSVVIAAFLVALMDGKIDLGERRMLGVVYFSLKVAMLSIAATLGLMTINDPQFLPGVPYYWLLTFILFFNAWLMTKHYISSKFGPSIQAATWYTLGFLVTIDMFALYELSPLFFLTLYAIDILLAVLIVNLFIRYFVPVRPKTSK